MSKIKNLKNDADNNFNVVDIISLIVPDGKSKYVETLMRIMKKTSNIKEYVQKIKTEMNEKYGVPIEKMENISDWQMIYHYRFFDSMFEQEDLIKFQKFCELNERGLVQMNDLTKYDSFKEIKEQTDLAELKSNLKEMEKQIKKIYETHEWLVIRPLTYQSSMKYGSNTKWCTAGVNQQTYFDKYSKNGILLYMINKTNALKVACYKSLDKSNPEFSFWDQLDRRIDSLESELPFDLLKVISTEVIDNPVSNVSYLTPEDYEREERTKGCNTNWVTDVTLNGEDEQIEELPIMYEQSRSLTGNAQGFELSERCDESAPSLNGGIESIRSIIDGVPQIHPELNFMDGALLRNPIPDEIIMNEESQSWI